MRILVAAFLLAPVIASATVAADQPQVIFRIELADAARIIDCPIMAGYLGQSFSTVLANGMTISGGTTPLAENGVTTITVNPPDVGNGRSRPMVMTAKLAQQKPSAQFTVPGSGLRLTVMVESPPLLATTKAQPSWTAFQREAKPNNAFERTNPQQTCAPLLRTKSTERLNWDQLDPRSLERAAKAESKNPFKAVPVER